jgi:uncharacterized membrane protein
LVLRPLQFNITSEIDLFIYCDLVKLTISYEVPDALAPFASGVSPLVESILQQDLDRFAKFAKTNYLKSGKI